MHGGLVALLLFTVFVLIVALDARSVPGDAILVMWFALLVASVSYSLFEPTTLPTRGWVVVIVALSTRSAPAEAGSRPPLRRDEGPRPTDTVGGR